MSEMIYLIGGIILGLLFSWLWLERRMSAELETEKTKLADKQQLAAQEINLANEDNQELREKLIALETTHQGCERERTRLQEQIASLEASSHETEQTAAKDSQIAALEEQLAEERERRQALRSEFERIEAQLARSSLGALQMGGESVALHEDSNPFEHTPSTGLLLAETESETPTTHDVQALFTAPTDRQPDDLKKIKGIGPVLERKLHNLGIATFSQVAALDENDIAKIDSALNFKGRIRRERWVEQAKSLA